jgi:small subunit ribosomal protein S14
MATTARRAKNRKSTTALARDRAANKKTPKLAVRHRNRCWRCGRSRAFLRKFGVCRLCFRQLALNGEIPGVIKASW